MTLHEYPNELKSKVLEALKNGMPKSQVIAEYGVSLRSINRWTSKKSSTKSNKSELRLLKEENQRLYRLLNIVLKRLVA